MNDEPQPVDAAPATAPSPLPSWLYAAATTFLNTFVDTSPDAALVQEDIIEGLSGPLPPYADSDVGALAFRKGTLGGDDDASISVRVNGAGLSGGCKGGSDEEPAWEAALDAGALGISFTAAGDCVGSVRYEAPSFKLANGAGGASLEVNTAGETSVALKMGPLATKIEGQVDFGGRQVTVTNFLASARFCLPVGFAGSYQLPLDVTSAAERNAYLGCSLDPATDLTRITAAFVNNLPGLPVHWGCWAGGVAFRGRAVAEDADPVAAAGLQITSHEHTVEVSLVGEHCGDGRTDVSFGVRKRIQGIVFPTTISAGRSLDGDWGIGVQSTVVDTVVTLGAHKQKGSGLWPSFGAQIEC